MTCMDSRIKIALDMMPDFIGKLKVKRVVDHYGNTIKVEMQWPHYTHYRRKVLRWFYKLGSESDAT